MLRLIKYTTDKQEIVRGYFHQWIKEANHNVMAIIEKADGTVVAIPIHKIKFIDSPEKGCEEQNGD